MSRRALAAFADRATVDVAELAAMVAPEDPSRGPFDLAGFTALLGRLPSGIVHAEEIWAVSGPPPAMSPLGGGTPWYASEARLAIVTRPGADALAGLFSDLAQYAACAAKARARLPRHPALLEALAGQRAFGADEAQALAWALDAPHAAAASLAAAPPEARAELAAVAKIPFEPVVRIDPALRPAALSRAGVEIGDRLASALPGAGIALLVSDTPLALEVLSPYVRDLGHSLAAWALENAGALSVPGLLAAIAERSGRPDADLSALVAQDLLVLHPELIEERRAAERRTGWWIEDRSGTAYGFADLSRIEGHDPAALPAGAQGIVGVLAGGPPEVVEAAARRLLETGRVGALAVVAGIDHAPVPVVLPTAVVGEDDGHAVPWSSRLAQSADRDLPIGLVEVVSEIAGPSPLACRVLGLSRRAELLGRLPPGARRIVVLHRRPPGAPSLDDAVAPLHAARVALAGLLGPEPSTTLRPGEKTKLPSAVRFRV